MLSEIGKTYNSPAVEETEHFGARGSLASDGIRIHSVRLPGLIAHQEVILVQLVKSIPYGMILAIALVICQECYWQFAKSSSSNPWFTV
jgi:hypothetical protein